MDNFFHIILTRYRGWVIFLFAVPFSFVYQRIENLKNWYYRNFLNTNKLHQKEVKLIQSQVIKASQDGRQMCTARPPWKTMSVRTATYKDGCVQITINLKNVLALDEENLTVRVEPMVTMGDITHYLLRRGYALAIQVEMDDLTVGGLCMGIGIETSSHRYGFLFETIKAYELILSSGELIWVTKESYADIYHALPMSHGTLGFLVSVELEIVNVKEYMKLRYLPCHSLDEFTTTIRTLSTLQPPHSFLEALIFSPQCSVIMVGEFSDAPINRQEINRINNWHKQWFYSYVETFINIGEKVEYIPLRHYFHRHTPSIFFQLRDLIPFANTSWYRWLFAWMGAPKISLMKFTMTKELRRQAHQSRVAQDIIIPISKIDEGISFINQHFDIYPLWVCPVKIKNKGKYSGLLPKVEIKSDEIYVDLGIYGIPPSVINGQWRGFETTRKLEQFTRDNGGFQMLYGDIFMTRSEFNEMFDHSLYKEVRKKYGADKAFPEIYDKVIPENWLIDIEKEVSG